MTGDTDSFVTLTSKENPSAMARTDSAADAAGEDRTSARLYWGRTDVYSALTLVLTAVALAGVAIAGTMAIVGLPTADLHGPLHRLGIMDPFSGALERPGTPRKAVSAKPGATTR